MFLYNHSLLLLTRFWWYLQCCLPSSDQSLFLFLFSGSRLTRNLAYEISPLGCVRFVHRAKIWSALLSRAEWFGGTSRAEWFGGTSRASAVVPGNDSFHQQSGLPVGREESRRQLKESRMAPHCVLRHRQRHWHVWISIHPCSTSSGLCNRLPSKPSTLIDCLIGRLGSFCLIDRSIDWLIDWVSDLLHDRSIDSLIYWTFCVSKCRLLRLITWLNTLLVFIFSLDSLIDGILAWSPTSHFCVLREAVG